MKKLILINLIVLTSTSCFSQILKNESSAKSNYKNVSLLTPTKNQNIFNINSALKSLNNINFKTHIPLIFESNYRFKKFNLKMYSFNVNSINYFKTNYNNFRLNVNNLTNDFYDINNYFIDKITMPFTPKTNNYHFGLSFELK